jgi:hypothetical protein
MLTALFTTATPLAAPDAQTRLGRSLFCCAQVEVIAANCRTIVKLLPSKSKTMAGFTLPSVG